MLVRPAAVTPTDLLPYTRTLSEYLCNVIDDMGLTVEDSIKALAKLLKMTPEELADKAAISGMPDRYVHLIKEAKGVR